jgi:peptidoglycan-associated lipoprotein
MTGPADETAREPTDGVARIWQLYADEIGLPDASATAPARSTPPRANVPSAPAQGGRRRSRVRLGVATVTAVVVGLLLVIGLAPQIRILLDSRANRTPSSGQDPVKHAGADLGPATTPLPSDGRPTAPVSVSAPADADPGRAGQSAGDSPSTSAIGSTVSVDARATPARGTPVAEREPRLLLPHRIMFDFGADVLTGESRRTLQEVAAAMKANPDWHVMIAGHTDSHGPPVYNMALSERRAQAAKAYLESLGISAQRLRALGFAGSRPLAANNGSLAFLNRRVDFHRR